jgi:hypothetical protein
MAERSKPGVPQTPLASASCCRVMPAIVIAPSPKIASADTMAITANVVLFISELQNRLFHLRFSAIELQKEIFSIGYT